MTKRVSFANECTTCLSSFAAVHLRAAHHLRAARMQEQHESSSRVPKVRTMSRVVYANSSSNQAPSSYKPRNINILAIIDDALSVVYDDLLVRNEDDDVH